jgi:hypothetical protein
MTMNQRTASVLRQVLAVLALVFGALTQAVATIKIPPAASVVMGIFGTVILGLEHYVSDPSTGSTPAPTARPAPPVGP